MTRLDLDATKAQYVAAARLCARAGFAAVELHVGHGYLLSQFLTPLINRRSDGYGGRGVFSRKRVIRKKVFQGLSQSAARLNGHGLDELRPGFIFFGLEKLPTKRGIKNQGMARPHTDGCGGA